ncbi:hypothetical protein N7493_005706 [Penicillium malachiteum]|uniref:Adenylyl cyclase-associated protein n=1 Tax=Penicillium malachiteum TaxID=1324776 RepID=A0AAD6MWU4_9EURO|nr:hypothetical protein N7493_005706 [Penicillium malachiteum]
MASGGHMHNFTTLIKRVLFPPAAATPAVPEPPKPAPPPPAPPAAPQIPAQIQDFDALIKGDVQNFVNLGEKIGGLVAEQSKAVLQAFQAERTYLYVTTKAKKPERLPAELMTDLHKASDSINNVRESNRASPYFNHLSAVAEGIIGLGWFFEEKPNEFVLDTLGAIQYYGNKVLKEYKEKDQTHVQYIQAYNQNFKGLAAYLKKNYPKGLTWNNESGIDALEALKQIKSGPGAPAGPGVVPLPLLLPQSQLSTFLAVVLPHHHLPLLNQGEQITSGLRKVDKSQMTHKNPSLRAGSTAPEGSAARGKSPAPSKKPKPESMRTKKPPRRELEGNKWLIENFEAPDDIIEVTAAQNQSILISRCNKTIVKVNGKANAIAIDNCNGLSIIVDSLVSSLDIIKCPKFAVQIDGTVPTVLLDQVDGATIYLGQQSLATEVFTSKCSAVNIMLPPKEGTDDDTKECPLPEQIKSYVKDGVLVNEIVEHAG